MTTPENIRAATYLVARERLDLRGGRIKCKPPNRQCGNRCIPPNWKCRVKGEGTDGHSKAVAGDPLAGAAAIARGQRRLLKGLKSGDIVEIQAGRAAISRGLVKAVPGQNLQQKQQLRKVIENGLVPLAGVGFAAWAIKRGHEGAKLLIPAYAKGPAIQIENAANQAITRVLDSIPIYGRNRQVKREAGAAASDFVARTTAAEVISSAQASKQQSEILSKTLAGAKVSEKAVLNAAISEALDYRDKQGYSGFKNRLLSGVLGAKTSQNVTKWEFNPSENKWKRLVVEEPKSVFADEAAGTHLAAIYGITPQRDKSGAILTKSLTRQIRVMLDESRNAMIKDMDVRGLDRKRPEDVETYISIASASARARFGKLPADQAQEVTEAHKGTLRELLTPPVSGPDRGYVTTQIAKRQYDETVSTFNKYFLQSAERVRQATDPRLNVVAASSDTPLSVTLVGVAERLKGKVGLENRPIAGGNHAELVLQKLFYEYASVPKGSRGRGKSTWLASDFDIRAAAQDLGWNGQGGVLGAYAVVRPQFPRLAAPPSANPTPPKPRPQLTGQVRPARKQSDAQRIAAMMRQKDANGNPRYATREAAEAELRRLRNRRDSLPTRIQAYLSCRVDLKERPRLGKPCGASHIPKDRKCRKGEAAPTPIDQVQKTKAAPSTEPKKGLGLGAKTAIGVAIAAVGSIPAVVAMDAYKYFNNEELPEPPSYRSIIRKMRKSTGEDLDQHQAIGRYYDEEVKAGRLKKGDLVYTKQSANTSGMHFAVYLGSEDGKHHAFAEVGMTGGRAGRVGISSYGPTSRAKGKALSVFVPAPPVKGEKKPFTPEEVEKRARTLVAEELKYDVIDNNCEQWARMIVSGNAKSTQVSRLTGITQSIYRMLDRHVDKAPDRTDLPSIEQQAQMLDYWKRIRSGDALAYKELEAFKSIIKNGKRSDAIEDYFTGLPDPADLLKDSRSDVETAVLSKHYLMLVLAQARAIYANSNTDANTRTVQPEPQTA